MGSGFRNILAAPVLAASLLLGGCETVQLEGAIFERLGVAGEPQRVEHKMPDRAPLVLPPKRNLPAPGPREVVANPQAWPKDPNETLKQQEKARKLARKKQCSEGKWAKKASIEEFEKITDPLLRCKGLGLDKDLPDAIRGEGSPDTLVQGPEGSATPEPTPSPKPWRNQITQTKPAQ